MKGTWIKFTRHFRERRKRGADGLFRFWTEVRSDFVAFDADGVVFQECEGKWVREPAHPPQPPPPEFIPEPLAPPSFKRVEIEDASKQSIDA